MSSPSDISIPGQPGKKTDFWGSKPKITIRPEDLIANGVAPSGRVVTFPAGGGAIDGNAVLQKVQPDAAPKSEPALELDLLGAYHRAVQGIDGKFCLMCSEPARHQGAKDKATIYHFKVGEVAAMMSEALARGQHQNVYFDPGLRRSDLKKSKRGELKDIVAMLALVLEEDNDTGKLLTLTPNVSPTFVVETSHNPAQNRHFHFLDDHPVLPQEAQELAELAYRKMGGDTGGKDIAHPWRVPGTLNFPTWQKLQRGRPIEPQPVKLIGGTGERVNVKALRETLEAMPDLHPPKRPRKKKATCGDAHQQRSGLGDGGVDRNAILDRLNELLRIQIDLEGTDRSVHCARVLFNLFYAGLTIEEVLAVAKGSAFARKFDERGDLVEEVERAYDRWHAEVNAPPSPPSLSPPKNGPLLDEHDVAIGCTLHVEPKFDPEEEDRAKPPPPKDEEEFSSDPQGSAFSATDRAEAYRVVGYMNRKYALIRSYAGKTLVMQEAANERGQPQEYWYTIYDFHAGAAAPSERCAGHGRAAGTGHAIPFVAGEVVVRAAMGRQVASASSEQSRWS